MVGVALSLKLNLAEHSFAVSALTMAEILVGYRGARTLEAALDGFQRIGVNILDIPASASVRLAELRQQTKLRMPDCCVLLAALQESAAGICTFDDKLATSARQFGLIVHGGN